MRAATTARAGLSVFGVGLVAFWPIDGLINSTGSLFGNPVHNFSLILTTALQVLWEGAGVLVIIGFGELLYRRRAFNEQIKMTHKEMRDEQKDVDGDPMLKGRRRQTAQQLARQPRV